jgi:hypothetical protein
MEAIYMNKQWIATNGPTLILGVMVLIQWIALQALLIHYHLFRKNLKQPRPDGIRLQLLEQTVSLQNEQLDRIYTKLSDMRKELNFAVTRAPAQSTRAMEVQSLEKTYTSLGEMNLKRRIQELKSV